MWKKKYWWNFHHWGLFLLLRTFWCCLSTVVGVWTAVAIFEWTTTSRAVSFVRSTLLGLGQLQERGCLVYKGTVCRSGSTVELWTAVPVNFRTASTRTVWKWWQISRKSMQHFRYDLFLHTAWSWQGCRVERPCLHKDSRQQWRHSRSGQDNSTMRPLDNTLPGRLPEKDESYKVFSKVKTTCPFTLLGLAQPFSAGKHWCHQGQHQEKSHAGFSSRDWLTESSDKTGLYSIIDKRELDNVCRRLTSL